MDNRYSRLFERAYIGKMGLKNRVVMSSMGTNSDEADGSMAPSLIDYYEARAKGGVGMIILEGTNIDNKLESWTFYKTVTGTYRENRMWRKAAERIKAYGTRACLQMGTGMGRNAFPPPGMDVPMISASEVSTFYFPNQKTRAMKIDEIHLLTEEHARTALRAKICGFDCVELNAHVGYLLDQFMSEVWNHRTDEYGGSFENRMRFSVEVVKAVREAVGPDYPILFKLSIEHKFEGGRTVEDGIEIIKALQTAGVDAFDLDAGSYDAHQWLTPPAYLGDACNADLAGMVKKATGAIVLNTGNYTPETAIDALEKGKIDYVMLGRGLLADPEWANKLLEGRREDIRPCIRCNEYCIGNMTAGCCVSCSVNAAVGEERDYVITKTEKPKNVVIIGGGPGGLEAARVAALKGHKVTLCERKDILGGQITAAATPDFKSQLREFIEYQKTQVRKLGVDIRLNKEISADSPELKGADQIIVAVGAKPIIPNIKGIELPNVLEIADAHLAKRESLGENVVIACGGLSGCDLAIELAMERKNVTIVEMLDTVAAAANFDNKLCIFSLIEQYGIKVLTKHKLLEFTENGVTVENLGDGKVLNLAADSSVAAFGMKADTGLADSICNKYPTAIAIGDCTKVAQVGEAVRSGYFTAWAII